MPLAVHDMSIIFGFITSTATVAYIGYRARTNFDWYATVEKYPLLMICGVPLFTGTTVGLTTEIILRHS